MNMQKMYEQMQQRKNAGSPYNSRGMADEDRMSPMLQQNRFTSSPSMIPSPIHSPMHSMQQMMAGNLQKGCHLNPINFPDPSRSPLSMAKMSPREMLLRQQQYAEAQNSLYGRSSPNAGFARSPMNFDNKFQT